jgi:hypothetical protein
VDEKPFELAGISVWYCTQTCFLTGVPDSSALTLCVILRFQVHESPRQYTFGDGQRFQLVRVRIKNDGRISLFLQNATLRE